MLADGLTQFSLSAYQAGDLDTALAATDEAYEISRSIGNVWGQLSRSMQHGMICFDAGNPGAAIAPLEEALRLSEQHGAGFTPILHLLLGLHYSTLGALERGLAHYERAKAGAHTTSDAFKIASRGLVAQLALYHDDLARAEAAIRDIGLNSSKRAGFAGMVFLPVGQLALAREEYGRTATRMDELITYVRERGQRVYLPEALYLKGRALLAQGDEDAGLAALTDRRAPHPVADPGNARRDRR
jgi:tetratricopeptide (TPR) repeat protein